MITVHLRLDCPHCGARIQKTVPDDLPRYSVLCPRCHERISLVAEQRPDYPSIPLDAALEQLEEEAA